MTKLEWTNPHARIYIDVKDDKGNVVNWDFELGPPNGLMRRGWNRNSLRQGHVVTINGFLSKLAPRVANARTVKLADGREVFAGSSFDAGPTQDERGREVGSRPRPDTRSRFGTELHQKRSSQRRRPLADGVSGGAVVGR